MNKLLLRRRVVLRVIVFADPLVKSICVENWGGATGGSTNVAGVAGEMTYEQAAAVTELGEVFRSKNIVSFDELQYFTGLTGISNNAFRDCMKLENILLPNTITSIGNAAFFHNSKLLSFVIPDGVTTIGTYFLYGAFAMTGTITIPSSVTSTGQDALAGTNVSKVVCYAVGSLLLSLKSPNLHTIGSIGSGADVELANGTTSLSQNMFRGGSGYVNIVVPEGIKTIEQSCFNECSNLVTVVLPSSITNLSPGVFANTPIESLTVYATNPPRISTIFPATPPNIYVPAGSVETYKTNQYWSAYADKIQAIPSN